MVHAQGRLPHLLTRGYGGRASGPLRVDPARHTVREVGDEALLLAERAITWVARDRPAGAGAAVAAGAEAIIMDDGFQNPSLAKDLSLVVVDADYLFGNGRLLPAGPLREPVARGLSRADGVVLVEGGTAPMQSERPYRVLLPSGLPVLKARLLPTPQAARFAAVPVVAFAGIARPEKFFETLQGLGAEIRMAVPFADHHPYAEDEIMRLVEQAHGLGARLVTTAKDLVRLPVDVRAMVEVVEVILEFEAPEAVDALIERTLDDG